MFLSWKDCNCNKRRRFVSLLKQIKCLGYAGSWLLLAWLLLTGRCWLGNCWLGCCWLGPTASPYIPLCPVSHPCTPLHTLPPPCTPLHTQLVFNITASCYFDESEMQVKSTSWNQEKGVYQWKGCITIMSKLHWTNASWCVFQMQCQCWW